MKWDGMRAITILDGAQARLYSRNGREATESFPELAAALAETAAGRRFIVDGKVVAPDLSTGPYLELSSLCPSRGHVGR